MPTHEALIAKRIAELEEQLRQANERIKYLENGAVVMERNWIESRDALRQMQDAEERRKSSTSELAQSYSSLLHERHMAEEALKAALLPFVEYFKIWQGVDDPDFWERTWCLNGEGKRLTYGDLKRLVEAGFSIPA